MLWRRSRGGVYHYCRPKMKPPYTIWQEDSSKSFAADNNSAEQAVSGTLDYFTKKEYDPVIDQIQIVLKGLSVCWYLNSVQYEENTGIIHYEWVWEW